MRKLAFVLVLAVAACTTTPASKLLEVDQNFTKAAARVVAYEALAPCVAPATVNCRDEAVVATLKADVHAGDVALDAAWADTNDGTIGTAKAKLATLQSDLATNKVE